jgi:hypothetical protein
MIHKLSPSWIWRDAGRDKGNNDTQESAFIVAYRYILLQKQCEIFSDFCLNRFVEVLAFCMPSTDHPFAKTCCHFNLYMINVSAVADRCKYYMLLLRKILVKLRYQRTDTKETEPECI